MYGRKKRKIKKSEEGISGFMPVHERTDCHHFSLRGDTMTIQLIFKSAAVGILVTILTQVLKHSGRDEQAFLVSLSGLFIVLSWIIPCINDLFDQIYSLFQL